MDKLVYALWLHTCLGACYPRIKSILEQYKDAEQVFRSDVNELKLSGAFTPKALQRASVKNTDYAKKLLERSNSLGYQILSYSDRDYPDSLRKIEIPPLLLFVKGKLPKHEGLKVAIVGTREATIVGRQLSFEFGYNLSKNGALIVSGGAEGIDTAAHKGALQAGSKTVCVLGCGINYPYLMVNAPLREQIALHGAVISEFTPDAAAAGYTFPKRNRIISALSDCTLVVEAGKGSGSLITAAEAAGQKKTVFAVPGSIDNERALGSNQLLATGARAAVSYNDILKWYNSRERSSGQSAVTKDNIEKIRTTSGTVLGRESQASEKSLEAMKNLERIYRNKTKLPQENVAKGSGSVSKITEKPLKKEPKTEKTDNLCTELLTESAKTVYHTISETPSDADSLRHRTGLDINEVLSALTELEMQGLVTMHGFGKYTRK